MTKNHINIIFILKEEVKFSSTGLMPVLLKPLLLIKSGGFWF